MNITTNPTVSTKNHRARWAAIGAAVAVSLGAGGLGLVHATSPEGASAYIPINPCRLADTRPAPDNVGDRNTPIGENETWTLDGWGDVPGDCNLPSNSTGLELNVTAIGATAPSFLTIFPAGGTMPTASNLNPVPGEPPTPNSVTVKLADDGKFSVYNAFGNVNAIVDVVGYYGDHKHTVLDIANESGLVSTYEEGPVRPLAGNTLLVVGSEWDPIVADQIRVPSNGYLDIEVSGTFTPDNEAALNGATCQLGLNQAGIDYDQITFQVNDFGGASTTPVSFNSHRTVPVKVDDNPESILAGQSVELLCRAHGTLLPMPGTNLDGEFTDLQLTATFVPTSYNPVIFTIPPVINPLPPIIINPGP